jgi:polyisoprenoid-binding protein YceI
MARDVLKGFDIPAATQQRTEETMSGTAAAKAASVSSPNAYVIDPSHSTAAFSVRHLMVSNVRGHLGPVSGTLWLDPEDVTLSRVEATIDAKEIDTRDPKRDEHLRSADFLDVEKFPALRFRSTRVKQLGDERLQVVGDLTIRGITHEVALEVEGPTAETTSPWGQKKIGATATTKINRKDFGLTWNMALEAGGVVVGDEVRINIELELDRQA